MKRVVTLSLVLMLGASAAFADYVNVNSDETGASCNLSSGAAVVTVMHKFSIGATGARFRVELPAGSSFLQFNTAWSMTGSATTDLTVDYGQCLTGSWVVGTFSAILTPGIVWVKPAIDLAHVMAKDCSLVDHEAGCCGAYVDLGDPYCPCCQTVATDQTTWGAVKALYR